jgi:hypothetical protein
MHFDLTDEETAALRDLLRRSIENDRFPLSPRMRPYKSILAKIDPPTVEPLPPPKPAGQPSSLLTRKRRR